MSSWCLLLFPETTVISYADNWKHSSLHWNYFLIVSWTRHHMLTTIHYGRHTVLCPNCKRMDAGRRNMTAPAQIYGLAVWRGNEKMCSRKKGRLNKTVEGSQEAINARGQIKNNTSAVTWKAIIMFFYLLNWYLPVWFVVVIWKELLKAYQILNGIVLPYWWVNWRRVGWLSMECLFLCHRSIAIRLIDRLIDYLGIVN